MIKEFQLRVLPEEASNEQAFNTGGCTEEESGCEVRAIRF